LLRLLRCFLTGDEKAGISGLLLGHLRAISPEKIFFWHGLCGWFSRPPGGKTWKNLKTLEPINASRFRRSLRCALLGIRLQLISQRRLELMRRAAKYDDQVSTVVLS
jgi:hypothetical protein